MAIHKEDIKDALDACFPEFSLIMDDTPVFPKAECVMVRLVHKKTFKIVELIIHMQLYAEALNGSAIAIAAHVFDAMSEYGLDLKLKKWRASTNKNKNAISRIEAKIEVLTLLVFCISHGYSGCSMQHDAYYNFCLPHCQVQIRSI